MILCLAAAHTCIFNTSRQFFFKLNQLMKLFLCHSSVYTLRDMLFKKSKEFVIPLLPRFVVPKIYASI